MDTIQNDLQVFEQKHNCVQEEPPYCTAACPLRVDVRQMMANLQKGNWPAAYEEYRKKALFPNLLSRVCSQPCRGVCLRGKVEEAIEIRLVERALAAYVPPKTDRHYIRPKNRTVTVVGAGLVGSSAAAVLALKGYEVTVFEKAASPGGKWLASPPVPAKLAAKEITDVLDSLGVRLVLDHPVLSLAGIQADALLIASNNGGKQLLECSGIDFLQEYGRDGLFWPFAARPSLQGDAVEEIALGKQVATDIENFFRHAGVQNREDTAKGTKLFTPLSDTLAKMAAVRPSDGGEYTEQEAITEAKRCLLCECKACMPHCIFLQEGKQYPKQYIVEAQQSLKTLKLLQSKLKARRTNACNLCGLCKEYCPGEVDMSEIYLYSRRIMHKNGELPEAFHAFWLEDMAFSGSEDAFLFRMQQGFTTGRYLFMPGCQMGGTNPAHVQNTYRYLTSHLEGGVGLYLGCCGAPAQWAGNEEQFEAVSDTFHRGHKDMGSPTVIFACPTCEKFFMREYPTVPRISLWEVFCEQGLPKEACKGNGEEVSVFDPCASRYAPKAQQGVRTLLEQIGFQGRELPHHGRFAQCCGYGGLIYASNPKTQKAVSQNRIQDSELPYVSYCVNCCEIFRREGKRTWHMLDLLFGNRDAGGESTEPISLSLRRENRRRLKHLLLKEYWGGTQGMEYPAWLSLKIEISEPLQRKMDTELILKENVQQAIQYAENTENKLERAGQFICHLQIGVVTYWVIYQPSDEGGFVLDNVYSHRMKIEEETH